MIDNTVDKYLIETSLSRVREHMMNHDTGFITAFRDARDCGQGEKYTKKENLQRNTSLKAKLQRMRLGVTVVKGSYIENYGSKDAKEVGEQSFFVVDLNGTGKLEMILRDLGEEFEQDSILFIPKGAETGILIGTNRCPNGYPGYGKKIKMNNPVFGKSGEFMTRVNGRPFILKEDIQELSLPSGMMGNMGCKIISEKHWSDIEMTDEDVDRWIEAHL